VCYSVQKKSYLNKRRTSEKFLKLEAEAKSLEELAATPMMYQKERSSNPALFTT